MKPKVYTSPHCPRCELLKQALERLGVEYEELDVSSSDVMADLIMKDIYLNETPALEYEDRTMYSDELFKGDEVNLDLLRRLLRR